MLSLRPRQRAGTGLRRLVAPTVLLAGVLLVLSAVAPTGSPTVPAAAAQSPEIEIELTTNGEDADVAPGPVLSPGEPVAWRYLITVHGPTTMYDVIVSDSSGATPSCDIDGDGGLDGSHIHPGPLEAGQSFVCVATGTARPSTGSSIGSTAMVRAFDFDALARFEDEDRSFYTPEQQLVPSPGMTLQSLVNGIDADSSPGPYVAEGSTITWSYVITNTGNVPLTSVTVTTSGDVVVDCGGGSNVVSATLPPGSAATCSGTSAAATFEAGLQVTEGTVAASAVDPTSGATLSQLSARDPHNYTPVRLPEALAFTGPNRLLFILGPILVVGGLAVLVVGVSVGSRADRSNRDSATI